MRCRICGAKLVKEGDICSHCYELYQEEEDLKKDVNQRLVVKRKYSISYNLVRNAWIFLLTILGVIYSAGGGDYVPALLIFVVGAVLLGFLLFIDKRLAIGTKAIFYDRKAEYFFDFLFIHNRKTIKYSDIQDIKIFNSSMLQKRFDFGDICIYSKGKIPGLNLLGFQVKNVANANEILQEIGNMLKPIE